MLFGEREVAGAGIDQYIGAARRQARTGAVGDPGVAADFEADSHAAAIEKDVADRVLTAADFDAADDAGGPTAEPAGLVVDAISGQVLFGDET